VDVDRGRPRAASRDRSIEISISIEISRSPREGRSRISNSLARVRFFNTRVVVARGRRAWARLFSMCLPIRRDVERASIGRSTSEPRRAETRICSEHFFSSTPGVSMKFSIDTLKPSLFTHTRSCPHIASHEHDTRVRTTRSRRKRPVTFDDTTGKRDVESFESSRFGRCMIDRLVVRL